jgi:pyridoxine/pyridoxamine 5'-phosphate oxidase
MKELDLIDFWCDEQADLYEELEYRRDSIQYWIKTQIK